MRLAMILALAFPALAGAQTIVPELDQTGRPGEIARMVFEKSSRQFASADANGDGRLSAEEVATVSPFKANSFARFDKDADGFLSWQEFVGHDRWAAP